MCNDQSSAVHWMQDPCHSHQDLAAPFPCNGVHLAKWEYCICCQESDIITCTLQSHFNTDIFSQNMLTKHLFISCPCGQHSQDLIYILLLLLQYCLLYHVIRIWKDIQHIPLFHDLVIFVLYLCYVVSCYTWQHYAISCYTWLCYAISCFTWLHYAISCYTWLCYN